MRTTLAGLLAVGSALGAPAHAATTELEEIIVTAQKRSERLLDIPISVTAVTERSLEQQGLTDFSTLVSRQPGLHLSQDSTQSTFTVRGISSSTSADTTSATAGIYLDDYPLYETWFRFTSPDVQVFDVDRVEVLRGPQGTLYGATSLSGSVRILTNKPDLDKFSGKFEGTGAYTEDGGGNYAVRGMVNVPLVDGKLGMRAVAYYRDESGYIDNDVRGAEDLNSWGSYGGRFYLASRPADDWNILWSVMYQHDNHDDQDGTFYFPRSGASEQEFNSVLPTTTESDLVISSLVVDKEFSAGSLNVTATVGYQRSDNVGDGTPISTALFVPVPTPFYQPSQSHSYTLEARYVSDTTGPLRYVAGAYFNTRYRSLEQEAAQPALAPFWGTETIYDVVADQHATEIAAYGEGTWAFADSWEATLGLRIFKNDYDFQSTVSGLLNNLFAPSVASVTDISNSDSSMTPRLSLAYKPNSNLNLYGTISKGYRFGLTNYNSGANAGVPLAYEPDSLWNYELGAKTNFMDGRASLNSALFYLDWSDMQISFRNPNGQVYITNAGNARSYGIESELTLRPAPAWEVNAALTLGQAEMATDNAGIQRRGASARGPAVFGVKSGDRLPGSQKISGSAGIQYNLLDVLGGGGYIRVDDVYVGSSYIDFMSEGSLEIGDYNIVNVRAGYQAGRYDIVLFADNVSNSRGVVNAVAAGDITGLTDWAYRVRPRTVGVTVRMGF